MRLRCLGFFAASVFATALSRATIAEERIEALFRPLLAESIALSPDGRRVAYTSRTDGPLSLVVLDVENPRKPRAFEIAPPLPAEAASLAVPPPTHLRFLRWATPNHVVLAPVERIVPLPPVVDSRGQPQPNPDGPIVLAPILALDADARQIGTLVDARDFTETPAAARRTLADLLRTPQELQATHNESVRWRMPHLDLLGFFPADRTQLVLRTHGAYSIPARHLVDIRTGDVREFGGDWTPPPGEPQIFDWHRLKVVGERTPAGRSTTVWHDDDLSRLQRQLETKFPRRHVEILDWNDTRARVLFRVTGGSDPGRVFVFQRPEDLVLEILRLAPWLARGSLHSSRSFEFSGANGAPLSGCITWPTHPRLAPPPALVIFPSNANGHAPHAFDPETQVLADLGFVVVRLNPFAPPAPPYPKIEHAAIDDARAALRWLAEHEPTRPFDRTRIAAFGRDRGGYDALRALQLAPEIFRCALAIDAPRDPALASAMATLRAQLKSLGRASAFLELDSGIQAAQPPARATLYGDIDAFLTRHLHDDTASAATGGEAK